jgi:ActR/RegA family two-component response regulator
MVLVVDDDPGTRDSFERLLRYRGYDVLTAESGGQALHVIQTQKPDVVLVDLKLLDMTALDVIRELRARKMSTPCIVMTGFGEIGSAVSAMKLGAVDYLTKPVEQEDLEAAIERAFAGRADHLPEIVRADGMTRWALAIASILDAPHDPKGLVDWSRIRGFAPATLRAWCRTAAMPPKASLDLARILRAVSQARFRGWPAWRLLEVADHRTLNRLLTAGGLSAVSLELPTLDQVLTRQSFITEGLVSSLGGPRHNGCPCEGRLR